MRAARLHAYGGLDSIRVEDADMPEIAPDEVLVRVAAAGLNPLDVKLAGGGLQEVFPLAFPYVPGADLAGHVEAVGRMVSAFAPGDAVFGRTDPVRGGTFAEYAAVPARQLVRAPGGIALPDLAGVPTAAGTAWQALFEVAPISAGQTVFVQAGAGGVGSYAVQLAKLAGARVIATASGHNLELVRDLGADLVLDRHAEDVRTRVADADFALDTVGGDALMKSLDVLRPGGTLVSLPAPFDTGPAANRGVDAHFIFHQSDAGRLRLIAALIAKGSLRPVTGRAMPLRETPDALAALAAGGVRGKIILRIGETESRRAHRTE